MSLFSKLHPDTRNVSCQTLIHPFTTSCTYATLDMLVASTYGSAKFMAIVYSLHYLLKLTQSRDKAKAYLSKKTLIGYLQSVSYATASSTIYVTSNCLIRWALGHYNDWNGCFLSSFVAGLGILLETPSRRPLVITSYANMALDSLLRRLEELQVLRWSNTGMTITFMGCNALLMYLMKFGQNEQSFWFFSPENSIIEEKRKESYRELLDLFLKYSLSGLAVSAARLLFSDLTLLIRPWMLLLALLQRKNISLGLFLGSYVLLYKMAEKHLSNKKYQLSEETVTLLAGTLAGTAFRFQTSRTILASSMVNVFQILLHQQKRKGTIPKLPYDEMLYCLYNGFLYHMRAPICMTQPHLYEDTRRFVSCKGPMVVQAISQFIGRRRNECTAKWYVTCKVVVDMITHFVLVLLTTAHISHQSCHRTTTVFYRQLSKDLWAAQSIRESLFASLRDSTSQVPSHQTYFAVTTILDGLRRRTIDLYPILDDLPKLREMTPKEQTEAILGIITDQRHVGCAAELVLSSIKEDEITVEKNLTSHLDHVRSHNRAGCINELLDIFWSYLCTCRPTQPLIGGILVNVPVRMSATDARSKISGLLHDEGISKEAWATALEQTDPKNLTITEWLADLIKLIAKDTSDVSAAEALADGIIQIAAEPDTEDENDDSEEEVGYRISPQFLENSQFGGHLTNEDRGIYTIRPPNRTHHQPSNDPIRARRSFAKSPINQENKDKNTKLENIQKEVPTRKYMGPQKVFSSPANKGGNPSRRTI